MVSAGRVAVSASGLAVGGLARRPGEQLASAAARMRTITERTAMNLSFAFLFLSRILCFRMFRVLTALFLAGAILPAQAACLSTRESKPQDWYAW